MACLTPYSLTAFFNLELNFVFCHQCDNLVTFGLQIRILPVFFTALTMAMFPDHLLDFQPQKKVFSQFSLSCKGLFPLGNGSMTSSLHSL